MKTLKILFLFLFSFNLIASDLSDSQKIERLLNEVEKSELTFVRNGKEHSSKQARTHLEYKYNYVKKGFWFWQDGQEVNVKKFIEKIASGSSTTGKEYFIKDKKGKLTPTKVWLKNKLQKIEASQ